MFIQLIISSAGPGYEMRFESETPAECERMARVCHAVVAPSLVKERLAVDEVYRKMHPFRKGKTAKDRNRARTTKPRAK